MSDCNKELSISQIIEAPLEQLLQWQRFVTIDQSVDSHLYALLLISYLKGDLVELERVRSLTEAESVISRIAELRSHVLRQDLTPELISNFVQSITQLTAESVWLGESLFIAGYASYTLHDFERAIGYYEKSLPRLRESGAFKKALKCQQNILASKTSLYTGVNYIPEYQAIYREARKIKDFATCGLTLMNISREYQKLGALNVALDTINMALTYYQKDFGTMDYYLSLAHRAHLYMQMGDNDKSLRDIELCLTCDFLPVQNAIAVLAKIDLQVEPSKIERLLNPTWLKRMKNSRVEKNAALFTGLEEKLILLLRGGSRTRHQLAESLYGNLIDSEAAENRLKNLLVRIRKKTPGLIEVRDGQYRVRDSQRKIG